MRRVRVRLGNTASNSPWTANCVHRRHRRNDRAPNCRPDDKPEPEPRCARGISVLSRARGRAFDDCLPAFVTLHFHSQAAKAGIAIAASAQTVKLWLLQRGAFVPH